MANVVSAGEAVARATAAGVARSTAAWLLEVDPAAQGVAELHALAESTPGADTANAVADEPAHAK